MDDGKATDTMVNKLFGFSFALFLSLSANSACYASRVKDVAGIAGVRTNQLVGYGLVVGLDGTGDRTSQAPFTQQTFRNMLLQFGIRIPAGLNFELKNIAAVAISANFPPFAKIGQKLDVTVLSLGNATSLRGGQLLMTPLRGADNQVYAMAQGSVIVSGFGAQGSDGSKVTVNVTNSGSIPNGATIENTIDTPFIKNGVVTLELRDYDFTASQSIADVINKQFKRNIAKPIDGNSIDVDLSSFVHRRLPGRSRSVKDDSIADYDRSEPPASLYIPFIARIEELVVPSINVKAKIIVNSRTGTIVMDDDVTISSVAVAHGNLSVVVSERPYVSQPQAFSDGKTVTGSASDININQTQNRAFIIKAGASLKDLVDEINRVGAAPGDLIAILEAIKATGAIHAELEVI